MFSQMFRKFVSRQSRKSVVLETATRRNAARASYLRQRLASPSNGNDRN